MLFFISRPWHGSDYSMWGLWWTKRHWARFFSENFSFPLAISFHQCSVFIFIYLLLWPGQKTKPGNLPKNNVLSADRGALVKNTFTSFLIVKMKPYLEKGVILSFQIWHFAITWESRALVLSHYLSPWRLSLLQTLTETFEATCINRTFPSTYRVVSLRLSLNTMHETEA